jgi:hypothetical protein
VVGLEDVLIGVTRNADLLSYFNFFLNLTRLFSYLQRCWFWIVRA